MEVLVRNAEGNVSKRDREYAAKKLGRLDRYFHSAQKVEMVHREQGATHRIEITVFADGFTIRGEERDTSVQAAIDRVSAKLETRLSKLKGRIITTHRRRGHNIPPALLESAERPSNGHCTIAERKAFVIKPMSLDEAALQLEMLGLPFYVFRHEDSNQVAVLYKRKDRRYGLLEPEG
jgi:putative sigma-54 modulation protein